MSKIAGLDDFRKNGVPADIGTFLASVDYLVLRHRGMFHGLRTGDRGWVPVVPANADLGVVVNGCIGDAPAAGASLRVVPRGEYEYATQLLFNKPIDFGGMGKRATRLVYATNDGSDAIVVTDEGCYLHDFFLKPKVQAGSGDGIYIENVYGYGTVLERLAIGALYNHNDGFAGHGIHIYTSRYNRLKAIESGGNLGSGLYVIGTVSQQPNVTEVDACQFVYNGAHGIYHDQGEAMRIVGGYLGENDGWGLQTGPNEVAGLDLKETVFELNGLGGINLNSGRDHFLDPAYNYSAGGIPCVDLAGVQDVLLQGRYFSGGTDNPACIIIRDSCLDVKIGKGRLGMTNMYRNINDKGIRTIFDFGHVDFKYHVLAGTTWNWTPVYAGTGASSNGPPWCEGIETGVNAGSTALKRTLMATGLDRAWQINADKYYEIEFWLQRVADVANAIAYVKCSLDTVGGDLASAGWAFRIDNFALTGQSHDGVGLESENLAVSMSDGYYERLKIRHYPGNWVDFFVNDVWRGRADTRVPAGAQGSPYILFYIENGASAASATVRLANAFITKGS